MITDTKPTPNQAESGNKSKPLLANRCDFVPYGEVENRCKKCGYITWVDKNKTFDEIVEDMHKSGHPKPDCYNVCQADVSGSFLFDKSLLEEATIKQPYYAIGVDTYVKDALSYCLSRKVDGVIEILLSKTMRDENEFKQEVENLAKYFNADVFRSGE